MSTIDQWELDAREILLTSPRMDLLEEARKIVVLIDLVRKKDEALKYYDDEYYLDHETRQKLTRALALTVEDSE